MSLRIHNLTGSQALKTLASRWDGLTESEARHRLDEFGYNALERRKRTSKTRAFLSEFFNFFANILWLAAFLSLLTSVLYGQREMNALAMAIVCVIFINAIFSFWQSLKAERALEALERILPQSCSVLRDKNWLIQSTHLLVPGDIISLKEGDMVAADVRLLESHHIRVDTSHITGESLPSFRHANPEKIDDIAQAKNLVFAGMRVVSGRALGVVFATGRRTEFGQIADLTLSEEVSPSPLQEEIRLVSLRIAALALVLGIAFFGVGFAAGFSLAHALLFGIGIIVANVPEGLMPTLTLSLASAAQRLAQRNALIRRLPAVEALGSTTVICTDKTGTLTLNQLRVKKVDWQYQSFSSEEWLREEQLLLGKKNFLRAILLTHSLDKSDGASSLRGDPIELALVKSVQHLLHFVDGWQRIGEIPFDDSRRRQSVIYSFGDGYFLFVKGAPEVVIGLSSRRVAEDDSTQDFESEKVESLTRAENDAKNGFKVLAYALRRFNKSEIAISSDNEINLNGNGPETLEKNLEFLGLVALEDPLRPEVPGAVQACRDAGIRVVMVTGDHPETARYVAQQSGIFSQPDAEIVLGQQVEHWSKTQLQMALDQKEIAFARVKATQKLRIVEALKEKKEVVAVTGDGVNDAPALRRADVGIAMGLCGTDVARESSDIILLDDNFATIVVAIKEGRGIFDNIRHFITYILSSNVPEAVPYILYMLLPIPLPLTILQILAIDLGTDLVPALGLGTDEPNSQVMTRPPRARTKHLVDKSLVMKAYLWFGLWESVAAMVSFFYILNRAGWSWGSAIQANSFEARQAATATFVAVVIMQMANVFLCRSRMFSKFNRLIICGLAIEIVFIGAIQFWPAAKAVLHTEALPFDFYFIPIVFAGLMIFSEYLRRVLCAR